MILGIPRQGRSVAGVGNTPLSPPPQVVSTGFPSAISADRRYIEDSEGKPWMINGDTGWSLFAELSQADATTYLSDRADKGVNVVLANLIEHEYTNNTPASANANGDTPFTGTLGSGEEDFTTPRESYWSHVDWILEEARQYGITVICLPAYVGYQFNSSGWSSEIADNGTSGMDSYGTFLGNRYASQPNIIWCMGGDWGPTNGGTDLTDEFNALADAIKAVDTNHFMTAHARRGDSSIDQYNQSWLDINWTYSDDSTVLSETEISWNQDPVGGETVMPTYLGEARYGNEHGMSSQGLRKQAWQALVWGGFGHVYGNAPTWYFGEDSNHPANGFADTGGLDWRNQLDNFGADDLIHVWSLMKVRDIVQLTPDHSATVVTAGSAWARYNSQQAVIYVDASSGDVTIDKTHFNSATFDVDWYDPDTGTNTDGGTAAMGSGSEALTPPDSGDWILLLTDQSLNLNLP